MAASGQERLSLAPTAPAGDEGGESRAEQRERGGLGYRGGGGLTDGNVEGVGFTTSHDTETEIDGVVGERQHRIDWSGTVAGRAPPTGEQL